MVEIEHAINGLDGEDLAVLAEDLKSIPYPSGQK
jgi:hypothetical protein